MPYRCLVPAELTEPADGLGESIADSISKETGACVKISDGTDTPSISDRIVSISGTANQQAAACRHVVIRLRIAQGVDNANKALFVVLVPSSAAGAVVGAKGQKVINLMKTSGAAISVSREVLPDLQVQPVTLTGTCEQVVAGTVGVNEILQELVGRGRLQSADFTTQCRQQNSPLSHQRHENAEHHGSESQQVSSIVPAPVVFLVGIVEAGKIVGKQGCHIAELQQKSGAKIFLANDGRSLPGMKCGDRLVEIRGVTEESRAEGVRAVIHTIAGGAENEKAICVSILVPVNVLGYLIGKGGQTVKDIMSKHKVDIIFRADSQQIAGARVAEISGSNTCAVDAVMAVMNKMDELRSQQNSNTTQQNTSTSSSNWTSSPAAIHPHRSQVLHIDETMTSPPPFTPFDQEDHGVQGPMIGEWSTGTSAERAVLAGIEASGVLNHRLAIRVPVAAANQLDTDSIACKSGAVVTVSAPGANGAGREHCFVTATGSRVSTSLAALCLQQSMIWQI